MGERRGRPVAAVGVAVVTVALAWAVFAYGQMATEAFPQPEPGGWDLYSPVIWNVLAGVVAVGGLWWAWRLGTGRWGLRCRPTEPSPPTA